MPRVTRCPNFWLAALIIWFGVLWILSSSAHPDIPMPPIEDFDKVEHFGYFCGGAGLFSAYLFRKKPDFPQWRLIIPTVITGMALVGWLDECHQGFVPGRSGNDPFDWMADVLGAGAGAFFFKIIHRRLL